MIFSAPPIISTYSGADVWGEGTLRNGLLAALLIGVVDTFGKVIFPQAAGVLVYVLMALILLWKPDGLFRAG